MKMKKILALALAAVLLVAVTVAGTIAYLTDSTDEVKNTFTPSTLSVDIDETKPDGKTAQMVPGATIQKDPDVTYTTDVPAYVFVKITKANGYDTYMEDYAVADGWTPIGTAKTNDVYNAEVVFYKAVTTGATDDPILNPEEVKVKTDVTTKMMQDLKDAGEGKYPTLSFQAYIIQKDNLPETDMQKIFEMAKPAN